MKKLNFITKNEGGRICKYAVINVDSTYFAIMRVEPNKATQSSYFELEAPSDYVFSHDIRVQDDDDFCTLNFYYNEKCLNRAEIEERIAQIKALHPFNKLSAHDKLRQGVASEEVYEMIGNLKAKRISNVELYGTICNRIKEFFMDTDALEQRKNEVLMLANPDLQLQVSKKLNKLDLSSLVGWRERAL